MVYSNTLKTQLIQCHSIFLRYSGHFTVKTYRIKFESQLFEELKTEPKKKRVNKAWQTENMERMYQDGSP